MMQSLSIVIEIFVWISTIIFYTTKKTHSRPSQVSKTDFFARIINSLINIANYFCQRFYCGCLKGPKLL